MNSLVSLHIPEDRLNHKGVGLNISAVTLYMSRQRVVFKGQRSVEDPVLVVIMIHTIAHRKTLQTLKGKSCIRGQGLLPPPMVVTMVILFHNKLILLHPAETEVLRERLNQLFPQCTTIDRRVVPLPSKHLPLLCRIMHSTVPLHKIAPIIEREPWSVIRLLGVGFRLNVMYSGMYCCTFLGT